MTRWVLVSDQEAGWAPFAERQPEKSSECGRVQAIYTTSTPYTAHLIGLRLKRRFGLPWVADFRNPWVANTAVKPPTACIVNASGVGSPGGHRGRPCDGGQ